MKLRAIENLHRAGIDVALVVTIVRTVNDDQVGRIIKFAVENCDKISFVSFQPVSFTGRDEDIDDETRAEQRYTLSHLAEDVKRQTGATEPLRDWFPLSAASAVSDVTDLMNGPGADWGTMKCGCHPNCGIGTALLVNKRTKEMGAAVGRLRRRALLRRRARAISDAARSPLLTKIQTGLSVLRNYRPSRAPKGLTLIDLIKKFDKQSGGSLGGFGTPADGNRKSDEWLVLFVAGMWFQDLWNYDFRRTEMCIIPYGTQLGEISFCAYNTGVGWRHIVEKMYQNATVAEWYAKNGKHAVYANPRKAVPLAALGQPISLSIPKDVRPGARPVQQSPCNPCNPAIVKVTSADRFKAAADLLWQHWREGTRLVCLPQAIRPDTRAEGYRVQAHLEERNGAPLFGWKIAATSLAGQAHIAVDGPLAGRLLRENAVDSGGELPFGANHMRVAEAEFAFGMGRELRPRAESYGVEEVLSAVATLHPAIEVPDSRYEDFTSVGAAQLIADNACAHLFVLGPATPVRWRDIDLAEHHVAGAVAGKATHHGKGANVLGDPRLALTWLVNELSGLGIALKAGQIVTTGTCVAPLPIEPGDTIAASFGELGEVSVRLV